MHSHCYQLHCELTRIVRVDLIIVRFGCEFWKTKVEVLDDPVCRVAFCDGFRGYIDRSVLTIS